MAHQHLNAMMASYTPWREQANQFSQDVYAEFLRHIVVMGLAPMPWPAVVDILVGHNPQLLLTDQRSAWQQMADRAAAIFAGIDIENEFIDFKGLAPFPVTNTDIDYGARWGDSDADPVADLERYLLQDVRLSYEPISKPPSDHGKTGVDQVLTFFCHVDMSVAELHMLATMMHESRPIVLDLDPRGGEIPGVMEPSVFGRFAKRYHDGRPENPFDYHRHDPTKRQDTYRAMRRANKARGKRR